MELVQALRQRWWLVLGALLIVLLALSTRLATFYTDVLWFRSIGFVRVFWTLLTTQLGLGIASGLLMALLLAGNLMLARRLAPRYRIPSPGEENVERYRQLIEPVARPLLFAVSIVVGVLSGLSLAPQWPRFVMWANATEFGRVDPQFGRDLGFFVFVLPFHTLVNSWLFTALVITVLMTVVAHYVFGGIRPQAAGQRLTPQVNVHLSVLLAVLVAVRAWGFWLDRYMLSYSPRGQVTGLSYTDVNAELLALRLLTIIAAICVLLFLANIRFRGWLLPAAGVGILLIAAVVLMGIYPAVVQRLQVDPQELPREEPYIERNLELTRFAFGIELEDITFEDFPANSELSDQQVIDNQTTLESIRLWDPATLQNTYQQLQELRPYYDFRDVDVDRYDIDGEQTQVMLSVREVATTDLPDQARTWQNQTMVYTHGYGLVSSAVSTRRRDGQPVFLVNNIPPQGVAELEVENPRVYFGEAPPPYSIIGTSEDELDYDLGEGQPVERFRYDGADGVGVDSLLRRLAFGLRFAEPNIVLTNLITDESRILFKRNVRERVEDVAPYLKLDHDAYPVAVDGRIKWIIDGYTTSDMVPYSQRVDLAQSTIAEQSRLQAVADENGQVTLQEQLVQVPGLTGQANYIRNSVKAVVDAYDGTVTLYVADPDDPLIQTWRKVFPDSFTDIDEASEELRAHFRYPEDMFRVQAAMFETYHIPTAEGFYNKDDAWNTPVDAEFQANNPDAQPRMMRPYYLLMRLPGEDSEEFALIQPFTPEGRPNLIGWLAGRSDGDDLGQLKAYRMPPTKTVFGPEQVQARINQDDAVSEQITLWNQSGSRVRYGNLLVIPVEDSLLYAQPLFLRAQQSEIPELRRTVLVFGDQVVMEPTLEEALAAVFGEASPDVELPEGAETEAPVGEEDGEAAPDDEVPGAGDLADPEVAAALERAIAAFDAADQALADGDLGEYQRQTAEAEAALREVEQLLGGAITPAPAEGPAATEPAATEPAPAATER
ncbi:MAG TPA: UPF0182 family protein [Euzebyales bacterium]|nr:UPF0182 family protein [Euzebyales bacterium]